MRVKLCSFTFIAFFQTVMAAVENTLPPSPSPHVMAALTGSDGSVWIATEGKGVFRCSDGKTWEAMHEKKGFPATLNAYAIAEDGYGTIWVGTDNQGVALWDGKSWQRISCEDGLAGERVFAIAAHEKQLAIATSGGISMRNERTWSHQTPANGMGDAIATSLAYDEQGKLWASFACGGVGVLPARAKEWRSTSTSWYVEPASLSRQPQTSTGSGIPSNLGNAIATLNGKTYYGSTCGLALYQNEQWLYVRGKDYADKNKGLQVPLAKTQPDSTPPENLLLEDYVTALYPSSEGLWVGYRQQGVQLLDAQTLAPKKAVSGFNNVRNARAKWVRQFVRLPKGALYAVTYGGGLRYVAQLPELQLTPKTRASHTMPPSPASTKELQSMLAALKEHPAAPTGKAVFFWFEDWYTRGNWCLRYGRSLAHLNAGASPCDIAFCFDKSLPKPGWLEGMVGPKRAKNDHLRLWFHEEDDHENLNVLWNPDAGTRSEAEWDDHGEEYPQSQDGPDVWAKVKIPGGRYMLSLYFYNPNGRHARNGYRDFLVEVRDGDENSTQQDLPSIQHRPVLARTRIFDFAGSGCWKNFFVQGPRVLMVRVCRNHSFNTILNGVFLSNLNETPTQFHCDPIYAVPREEKACIAHGAPSADAQDALRLWSITRSPEKIDPAYLAFSRLAALASYRSLKGNDNLKKIWRKHLYLWTERSEKAYAKSLDEAWEAVQDAYLYARSKQYRPFSPGTVNLTRKELLYAERKEIDWKQYRDDYKGTPKPSLEELKRQAADNQ